MGYRTAIVVLGLFVCSSSHVLGEDREPTETAKASLQRVDRDLLALYDFGDATGALVRDRAGSRDPLDLKIEDPGEVTRESGSLRVIGSTLIRSRKPPKRVMAAIKRSGALTLEAWIRPRNLNQSGPARIVTLSKDSSNRNFTLGQDGDKFDIRLRTEETSNNGLPSLAGKSGGVKRRLTHVVFTRSRSGESKLWLNGKLDSQRNIAGNLSNWATGMRLVLGNELNRSRPWKGTYHLVAIYARALSESEVLQNFEAGAGALAPPLAIKKQPDPRQIHFELEVAPILANQCLECHDSLAKQGGLDLSRKTAALEGGDSGPALVANNSAESLLWQSVDNDEMPHERAPLSRREKQKLKTWIDDGAVWTLDSIDPAVYVHGGRPDSNWLRRLTVPEYIETIKAIFDVDVSERAYALLPPDVRADGFSNTAYNLNVDLKHIEAYQALAEVVVEQIDVRAFRERFDNSLSFTDRGMGNLIKNMGRLILRGPLETREIIAYRGIPTTLAATEDGDLDEATALIIEAMLQSPRFLYRVERQRGDGSQEPLDDFELASRLSYIVWGAPPDEPLFRAAVDGELYDEAAIRAHAERMLGDPRAVTQSERFFSEWLNLRRLDNMQPNTDKFPDWDPALADDMRKETLAFFREVVWTRAGPLSDLLNTRVTYATPRLARHYGLPPESADMANSTGELVRFDLSKTPGRAGMLTQGSVLTVGGDEASMVTRGLLVMHELLRGVVKDPPPCVDTTPVPTKPGLSQRKIAEQRIANETCGGCHGRFEPLAFGLEKFDGLGGYHERDEHGNTLREDGNIVFPGAAEQVAYESSRQLADLMAGSPRVKESITWKLTQFALGRPLTGADAGAVQAIHAKAQKEGGTYQATMIAIVTSELVTMMQLTD